MPRANRHFLARLQCGSAAKSSLQFSFSARVTQRLPAHKLKIQELTNRGEIVAIARDKVSADSPRGECDEDVKMNLSGFVDIKSLCGNKPVDDLSRLNPVSFSRSDDTEVFR